MVDAAIRRARNTGIFNNSVPESITETFNMSSSEYKLFHLPTQNVRYCRKISVPLRREESRSLLLFYSASRHSIAATLLQVYSRAIALK